MTPARRGGVPGNDNPRRHLPRSGTGCLWPTSVPGVPAGGCLVRSGTHPVCTPRASYEDQRRWSSPYTFQVGISGRAIAPLVYLAVGIRGAFNHTVGIQKAGVVVALNQNPRAAIFKAADYGIVGAWHTYLPPLVEALQPVLAAHLHQRSPRD